MDIIIGPTPPVGMHVKSGTESSAGSVEAKILNMRAPRKRRGRPPSGEAERRTASQQEDPVNGRVMVLLIPEGYKIPKDISSGNYRIFLRFVPRRS